jgi:orotate phosphoribosyltransferase-like protein
MTEDKEGFIKVDNQKLMSLLIEELGTNCDTSYRPTEEDLLRRKELLQEVSSRFCQCSEKRIFIYKDIIITDDVTNQTNLFDDNWPTGGYGDNAP